MGRTKFFLNNSFAAFVEQATAILVAFIVPRILIVNYGSEINGLVVSVTQFISYFLLAEAGLSGAAIFALYKPLAICDNKAVNAIICASKKFYILTGYIFLALVFILAIISPFIFKASLDKEQIFLLVLAVASVRVLDFFALSKYRVLLTADQKSFVLSSAQIVYYILMVVIIYFLAILKINIVILQWAILFAAFGRGFVLHFYTKRKYPYLDYKTPPDFSALKERWSVFYLQLLGSAQLALPIIIATIFCTLKEVSVFAIYNMVIMGIGGILSIFIMGISSSFGNVIAKGEIDILQKTTQEFEQFYYIIITVVYMVSLLMILPFVQLYTKGVDDVNYILPFLGFLFVLSGLTNNLKTPQGMLVVAAGMYRQTRVQSTIQGLIIVALGIIGASIWGLYGIVSALIISNIYRDIDLLFFVPKHITKLSPLKSLGHIFPVLLGFSGAILYFIYKTPLLENFSSWLAFGVFYTTAFAIIVVLFNLLIDYKNMKCIFFRILNILKGIYATL